MSLSKTLYRLLSTGLTQEGRKLSRHDSIIVDWDIKHQHKRTIITYNNVAQWGNAHSMAKIDDFLIQCSPFIMHLIIAHIWINAVILLFPYSFTMEFYKGIIEK